MSDDRLDQGIVLNWRGPLLAAAIFAAMFAILLLMAYQNESKTSDMGSSLREDPYGASLLFDSYRRAGYQVTRGQDEEALADLDASRTTAYFIGGQTFDWRMEKGSLTRAERLRKRIESFLARGGRVVLVAPVGKLKSESQGWELENKWNQTPSESGPIWVRPDLRVMPSDSEQMYLGADAPWLQTDEHWTPLYTGVAGSNAKVDISGRIYMAKRSVGNGELIAVSQESCLLNEAIKTHPNPALLDFLAGGRPQVWVDEALHGLHQDQGVLWLVHRYRLQAALLLFWATLLALLWSMSGNLVRRPAHGGSVPVVRYGELAGVASRRLLQRSIAKERVVAECWEQFSRTQPQDAQAISSDPLWSTRLRAALAQPPLAGYRELSRLIAERWASSKGLARGRREAP